MKETILLLSIFLFLTSCKKENNSVQPKHKIKEIVKKEKVIKQKKRIGDFMSDTHDFSWYAKYNDSVTDYPRLIFQKEFVVYQIHGQCHYWFFTHHYHTGADKIELLWTFKNDCLYEPKSITSSNGVKKYPQYGDAFCEYSLVNDSVIKVKYNFIEWKNKVNEIERDSIFPEYLYFEQKGS